MTRVYLLRHGQTDCTLANRFCGRHDPPLNATGVRMAELVATGGAASDWSAIYASPSRRARQTAAIVAGRHGMGVVEDEALAELDYGAWDGCSKAQVCGTDEYRRWCADPAHLSPPAGETAAHVAVRASRAVDRIRQRHAERDVLVVTHKATIRILVCHYLGMELGRFRDSLACPASSLTCLAFDPAAPMLVTLGDVGHLPVEWRDDPDHWVPGATRRALTHREVSAYE